ncbi:hypothetical protein FNV43_RR00051 [Rhamnella rubrinervis]|uniref:Ubiquitin-like protease family profile domain-containing protein n=1 Tax=Rhamnella rubrinervis TaxID=2594499 RepID=A0A8K0HMW3_9ROSA|nr:hypothetical protein FNV43_RR00051 [Rhamnella rubrinervis]
MTPQIKIIANRNKKEVKVKPSKKTRSDGPAEKVALATTTPLTVEKVAPAVNLSNEVSKSFDDVPNSSNPQQFSLIDGETLPRDGENESVYLCVSRQFMAGLILNCSIDVVRRKPGDDRVKAFKNTCFGHFLNVKSMTFVRVLFRLLGCYDGPPSVVNDVDDTTVDPPSEQVQPDRRTLTATAYTSHAPHHVTASYTTSSDVARLENKLDNLNRKVQLIMQYLGIEDHSSEGVHHSMDPPDGSPIVDTDPGDIPVKGFHTVRPKFRRLVKGATRVGRVPKKFVVLGSPYTPLQDLDTSLHPPLVDSSASTGDILTLMYDSYWALEENRRTLLMNFIDDLSKPSHGVDIMVLNKSSFHTILTSGAWLHSDVYVSVNNEDKHWLAVEVDLVWQHVTLYDSNCSASNNWFQTCNAESLGVLFPYLLAAGGFYDERPELTFNGTPSLDAFSMSRIDAALCPQQSSSLGDCGMFMLLCIDYLSVGRALDYSLDRIKFFREKYAVGLYNNEFTL